MRRADGPAALPGGAPRRTTPWATSLGVVLAFALLGAAFVACESPAEGEFDLAVYALESCSDGAGAISPASARVVVRGPETVPCAANPDEDCVEVLTLADESENWGQVVDVGGIPEGDDRAVTILAYDGGDGSGNIVGYARATGVSIRKGESTEVSAILTRFGGLSCPAKPAEFTHRAFATATAVADDKVVVAGGFTGVDGDKLSAPDNGVYVYASKTGTFERKAQMARARGAHTAAYIPGAGEKGWVVFFGGTASLAVRSDGAFPLSYDGAATDGAFDDYEVFDVASGTMLDREQNCAKCEQCCNPDGSDLDNPAPQCADAGIDCSLDCRCTCSEAGRTMARGRALAQPAVMSDGFVILTGGGDFPDHTVSDYRIADVFAPEANCRTGGFQDPMTAPRMESIRAGHTLTFIEATDAGRFRFLLWGGTKESTGGGGTFPIGESYTESSQQFKGISGVFRQVRLNNPELAPNLYWHSMTPLSGRRFLLAGGVRRSGDGAFAAPSADDVYLLTLSGEDVYTVDIRQVGSGLSEGRFLHTGTTHDGQHALLFGGYGDLAGTTIAAPRVFDGFANAFAELSGTSPLARAAHRAVVLTDDTLLLVGGLQAPSDLVGGGGLFEVYTPSVLNPLSGN